MQTWIVQETVYVPGKGKQWNPVAEIRGTQQYAEMVVKQMENWDGGVYSYSPVKEATNETDGNPS